MMSLLAVKQNKVSVIIPTRDRPADLADLLLTILDQNYLPLEVIVVDDSLVASARKVIDSLGSRFESHNFQVKYVKGSDDGLPAARNLGIKNSEGDVVLFLDDDTLLDPNVVSSLVAFLRDNPTAIGVQPEILSHTGDYDDLGLSKKLENAIYKMFLLTYGEKNKLAVRRSGASVLSSVLTNVISAQRLLGCCCCYKREIFDKLSFDTNLKRWGFTEDLDFSYRVYKMHPQSLYAVPHSKVTHKASREARLPMKRGVNMTTIYWSYFFFKDIYDCSVLNLMAFLWAMSGMLIVNVSGLIVKRKSRTEWFALIYLLGSYANALRHLKNIRMARLDFFNKNL
jgi:GT2 family glycosyltransferase